MPPTPVQKTSMIVNPVGASWFEDLSSDFLDESTAIGMGLVGCTANDTWDDTLETMENLQTVKRVVEAHPNAFLVSSQADLSRCGQGKTGVFLGLQNPKPFSDSLNFLEAFIDMGLRCCSLAFRDNSYYGCGFSSPNDSGLSHIGAMAVQTLNRRGVVIDLSHSGDRTAADAIATSEHPVIFSHSMSRELMMRGPKVEWAGVKNNAVLRAAPDALMRAAAAKGGVVCPDARIAGSVETLIAHIDHMVQLVGIDHVAVCAQDDWHRSSKDVRRIQPYLPGYDSVAGKGSRVLGSDYRIYRMEDQLGPKILSPGHLDVQLRKTYSEEDTNKLLGGNLLRVFEAVLA